MTTSNERLFRAISSRGEVKNIKFFLGDDRNISQEMLCDEAANAMSQVTLGLAKSKKSIDSDMTKTHIDAFLK